MRASRSRLTFLNLAVVLAGLVHGAMGRASFLWTFGTTFCRPADCSGSEYVCNLSRSEIFHTTHRNNAANSACHGRILPAASRKVALDSSSIRSVA
jgi:hypothetical protein